jgi:hypothetical protein
MLVTAPAANVLKLPLSFTRVRPSVSFVTLIVSLLSVPKMISIPGSWPDRFADISSRFSRGSKIEFRMAVFPFVFLIPVKSSRRTVSSHDGKRAGKQGDSGLT